MVEADQEILVLAGAAVLVVVVVDTVALVVLVMELKYHLTVFRQQLKVMMVVLLPVLMDLLEVVVLVVLEKLLQVSMVLEVVLEYKLQSPRVYHSIMQVVEVDLVTPTMVREEEVVVAVAMVESLVHFLLELPELLTLVLVEVEMELHHLVVEEVVL